MTTWVPRLRLHLNPEAEFEGSHVYLSVFVIHRFALSAIRIHPNTLFQQQDGYFA